MCLAVIKHIRGSRPLQNWVMICATLSKRMLNCNSGCICSEEVRIVFPLRLDIFPASECVIHVSLTQNVMVWLMFEFPSFLKVVACRIAHGSFQTKGVWGILGFGALQKRKQTNKTKHGNQHTAWASLHSRGCWIMISKHTDSFSAWTFRCT